MELTSIPLAFVAGALGIVSPCVWPLVPIMLASVGKSGWRGKCAIAAGLALAFALAGGILSWLLISLGLDPLLYRHISSVMLLIVGGILVVPRLSDGLANVLSRFVGRMNTQNQTLEKAFGPFGIGLMLGFVWLPCVGPTLGAAIALASRGQDVFLSSMVMMSFGLGTATTLLLAATGLNKALMSRPPTWFAYVRNHGKRVLGILLLMLGVMVLTGFDLYLERLSLRFIPDWSLL